MITENYFNMKTTLQTIIDELEEELKNMDIDEYYKYSPIFKWVQKLCKIHLQIEEKQIVDAFNEAIKINNKYCDNDLKIIDGIEYYKIHYK